MPSWMGCSFATADSMDFAYLLLDETSIFPCFLQLSMATVLLLHVAI